MRAVRLTWDTSFGYSNPVSLSCVRVCNYDVLISLSLSIFLLQPFSLCWVGVSANVCFEQRNMNKRSETLRRNYCYRRWSYTQVHRKYIYRVTERILRVRVCVCLHGILQHSSSTTSNCVYSCHSPQLNIICVHVVDVVAIVCRVITKSNRNVVNDVVVITALDTSAISNRLDSWSSIEFHSLRDIETVENLFSATNHHFW